MKRLICAIFILYVLSGPVSAAYPAQLVPGGGAVALELRTDGVFVTGFSSERSPAQAAGIKEGDRILSVNGAQIGSPETLGETIRGCAGGRLYIRVLRGGKEMSFTVLPERASESWRIGVLARDTIRGIGTVTFYDPERGLFGALGHGVSDKTGTEPTRLRGGSARQTQVVSVIRGEKGKPGSLCGAETAGRLLGSVERNTDAGIFGHAAALPSDAEPLPTGGAEDAHEGRAEILCTVGGSGTERYSVQIEEIDPDAEDGRDLLVRITDERLLAQTGGIVQGMSGSPILQDGKLIGAITHVLVRDPTEGYGILIGNMLEASEEYEAA